MTKQSECQGADEDIQRRMVSNWKTSEIYEIHKYWLKLLTDPYLSSKFICKKCCKRLEGWRMLIKTKKKRGERGGIILKTCKWLTDDLRAPYWNSQWKPEHFNDGEYLADTRTKQVSRCGFDRLCKSFWNHVLKWESRSTWDWGGKCISYKTAVEKKIRALWRTWQVNSYHPSSLL